MSAADEESPTDITFSLTSNSGGDAIESGDAVIISVMVNVKQHDVRGVEVALKYDPTLLNVLSLETGNFLFDVKTERRQLRLVSFG